MPFARPYQPTRSTTVAHNNNDECVTAVLDGARTYLGTRTFSWNAVLLFPTFYFPGLNRQQRKRAHQEQYHHHQQQLVLPTSGLHDKILGIEASSPGNILSVCMARKEEKEEAEIAWGEGAKEEEDLSLPRT